LKEDYLVRVLRHLEKTGFVPDPEIEVNPEFEKLATEVLQD